MRSSSRLATLLLQFHAGGNTKKHQSYWTAWVAMVFKSFGATFTTKFSYKKGYGGIGMWDMGVFL